MIAPAWSDALTGLAGKNNATQAKAWAKFPWPFGPKPHLNPTDSWAEIPMALRAETAFKSDRLLG
jgi:hypothetical protein